MILKKTGAGKILVSFLAFVFIIALIIFIFDPSIKTYRDALWYCYAVISTAGFGDIVATKPISKICSVLLTCYSALVLAIVTGVVVNYYNMVVDEKMKNETEDISEEDSGKDSKS